MTKQQAVFITGASTGIGRACALQFDRLGYTVFATVRKDEDAASLADEMSDRLVTLRMDITDGEMITAAADETARRIEAAGGKLELVGLVNNSGIVVSGPVELVPLADWRRQFEVNVIGQIAVIQSLLPILHQSEGGRIVNISSSSGLIASPFLGPYASSKFALEAISDSLRIELCKTNVRVSLIEPGPIDTPIWSKSTETGAELETEMRASQDPARWEIYDGPLAAFKKMVANAASRAQPVERVVRDVVHAVTARRPKNRYAIPRSEGIILRLLALMPGRMRDWIVRKGAGI